MASAENKWQQEKVRVALLLSISCPGRFFLDELPSMLEHWVSISTHESLQSPDELTCHLLIALTSIFSTGHGSSPPPFMGNDVLVMQRLAGVIHEVSSVEENTLSTQYEAARRLLPPLTNDAWSYEGDISDVDQLLIPALLGSSTPLRKVHAAEVKKYVLRDDDVSAIKLLAVYSMKDALHFPARLPYSFSAAALKQRITDATTNRVHSKYLYAAMKCMGCIGASVFDTTGAVHFIDIYARGFKKLSGRSLAFLYATYLDDELEGLTLMN